MGAERSSTGDLTDIVTSDVPTAVPGVGSSIGPYRVVRKLGSGGMGVVYEAVHKQIGRQAAIKLLHAQFAVQKDIVSRFLNEARAANLVRHPGIVDIYEFGTTPSGNAYIVMEYIDGVSLASRLKQAAAPLGVSALPMFQKMAQALAAAHDKGIVHRALLQSLFSVGEPGIWKGRGKDGGKPEGAFRADSSRRCTDAAVGCRDS